MSRRDNVPPDEHLRAALRHAPDAALAAPADLSAQILAAAHRAAAEPPPRPAPLKRPWWVFEKPMRLGASGAFATVLLAGVVGVLWQGQAPGPAIEAAQESAAAPAAVPLPAAEPPSSPAAARFEPPPKTAAKPAAPAERAAPAPADAPREARRAQQEQRALARVEELQRQAGSERARAEEFRRGIELKESARMAKRERDAAPAPPRQEAPALAAAPPPPPAPPPPAPVVATAPRPATVPAPAAPPAAAMADTAPAMAAGRGAPAATGGLMARPRPSGPWMDALAAGSEVQWKVDGETRAPTSSWLYALAEQTQGRWHAVPNPRPSPGDSTVQWQRGDTLLGRLWLGDERVLWCDAQGRCEEAALDAGVGPVLRKGLAR